MRKAKTDRQDSIAIANYGLDHWFHLKNYEFCTDTYQELKLLGRQYAHYMRMRIESVQEFTHLLDYTMPGIKNLLKGWNENTRKDKLADFVEQYWHFNNITAKTEAEFIDEYANWAKEKGYHKSQDKAAKIYALAKEGIPTLPITHTSVKMLVLEAIGVLREVDATLVS